MKYWGVSVAFSAANVPIIQPYFIRVHFESIMSNEKLCNSFEPIPVLLKPSFGGYFYEGFTVFDPGYIFSEFLFLNDPLPDLVPYQ